MKKWIVFLLVGIGFAGQAQRFEGVVKWTVKTEVTDPQLKARMVEAQKKMNDPATQAKMKEMQKKMDDPQMKAMMEANPQMKAQMESSMKMMQGGADMNAMMPSGFTVAIKGNNSLVKMEGGMMPMEVLHQGDKNQSVRIDREKKTYSILSNGNGTNGTAPVPVITKTSETAKILNYNCTKYIAELNERGKSIKQIFWTTTDIKDFDMKSLMKQRMGRGQSIFYEGIDGVPLKIEMAAPEANMIMEVVEIKRGPQPEANFRIPPDFKETKGMF